MYVHIYTCTHACTATTTTPTPTTITTTGTTATTTTATATTMTRTDLDLRSRPSLGSPCPPPLHHQCSVLSESFWLHCAPCFLGPPAPGSPIFKTPLSKARVWVMPMRARMTGLASASEYLLSRLCVHKNLHTRASTSTAKPEYTRPSLLWSSGASMASNMSTSTFNRSGTCTARYCMTYPEKPLPRPSPVTNTRMHTRSACGAARPGLGITFSEHPLPRTRQKVADTHGIAAAHRFLCRSGACLASIRNLLGAAVGSTWGRLGAALGSSRGRVGVEFWGRSRTPPTLLWAVPRLGLKTHRKHVQHGTRGRGRDSTRRKSPSGPTWPT